jgi:hypothetical protein
MELTFDATDVEGVTAAMPAGLRAEALDENIRVYINEADARTPNYCGAEWLSFLKYVAKWGDAAPENLVDQEWAFKHGTLTVWIRVLGDSRVAIKTGIPLSLATGSSITPAPVSKGRRASVSEAAALRLTVNWIAPRGETTVGSTTFPLFHPGQPDQHSGPFVRSQIFVEHMKIVGAGLGHFFGDRQIKQ